MSLTHAIARFKTGAYTVTRPAGGANDVHGVWQDGSPTTLSNVDASIQPYGGRKVIVTSDGQRVEDVQLMLTETPMRALDVVTVSGEAWVVCIAESWNKRGVTWSRAYLARQKVSP